MPEEGHQPNADPDADGGEQYRQDGRGSDIAPPRGETALSKNDYQCGEPERLSKIGIVEWDSDAGLAHN